MLNKMPLECLHIVRVTQLENLTPPEELTYKLWSNLIGAHTITG